MYTFATRRGSILLGVELPASAEEAEAEQFFIRCFKVWQSEQMHEQMVSVQVQIWNGEIYIMSPITRTGSLHDLGGGVWSRPAASFMTRWRLVPTAEEDRDWRLLELELYADSECTRRLPRAGLGGGGRNSLGFKLQTLCDRLSTIRAGQALVGGRANHGWRYNHRPFATAYASLRLPLRLRRRRLLVGLHLGQVREVDAGLHTLGECILPDLASLGWLRMATQRSRAVGI